MNVTEHRKAAMKKLVESIRKELHDTPLMAKIVVGIYILIYACMMLSDKKLVYLLCTPDMRTFSIWSCYRFVSCCFSHTGLLHLLANSVAVICIWQALPAEKNQIKYMLIFLWGGALTEFTLAIIKYCVFHQYRQGIGGSSAIYALIGAAVAVSLKRKIFWDLYTG